MTNLHGKNPELSIRNEEEVCSICRALSSPVRVKILQAINEKSKSVGELAAELDIPVSTAALSVQVLEEAQLITTDYLPGKRGSTKLCTRKFDSVFIHLEMEPENQESSLSLKMPIGAYTDLTNVISTCGLALENCNLGEMDNPDVFFMPERLDAQLIWFRQGMLEYKFSHMFQHHLNFQWLELSFEACSEAPMYRDPWPSDISVFINGVRLGVWTSPCDCGGRQGRLTPQWWPDMSTQFGFLKTWRVTEHGTYLDGNRIGNTTISDLKLLENTYITVKIGIEEDAVNQGGMNLFGEKFGDYEQPIMLRLGYTMN